MKKFIVIGLLAILLGAFSWHYLTLDPGYLLIQVAGKTIEMRLSFALILLILGILAWRTLSRLVIFVLKGLRHGWRWPFARSQSNAEAQFSQGLKAYLNQDWAPALKALSYASKYLSNPYLAYLMAARSASALGFIDQAKTWLSKAEPLTTHQDITLLLAQADFYDAAQKYEIGLSLLHKAKTLAPVNLAVIQRLEKTYRTLGDWASMDNLLQDIKKHKIYNPTLTAHLEVEVACHRLNPLHQTAQNNGEKLPLFNYWSGLSKTAQQSPQALVAMVQALNHLNAQPQAEKLLTQALKEQWHQDLVEQYGLLKSRDGQQQLATAEHWLNKHKDCPALHLALARICLRNSLWGKAKEYLQYSLQLQPSLAAYTELSRLGKELGDLKLSQEALQLGLQFANSEL